MAAEGVPRRARQSQLALTPFLQSILVYRYSADA